MKGIEKAEFKRTISYFWPLYLVIPATLCFSLTYLMHATHEPKSNEKVSVFVASANLDSASFKKQMETSLKEKGAKAANPIFANPTDVAFGSKLTVVGYHQADVFLIPESLLSRIQADEVLLPFRPALKENWVKAEAPEYYSVDGLEFGLRIHEKGIADGLSDTIDFLSEDYYLCLNAASKNLGDLGIYDLPEDKLGLEAFLYLQEAAQ